MTRRVSLILIMTVLLASSMVLAQSIDEPRYVNKILNDFNTPVIVPGQSGTFSFTVNNPDAQNLTGTMRNVSIEISIYQYATLEESLLISEIDNPPLIVDTDSPLMRIDGFDLAPGESQQISFMIITEEGTPHGSYFSQSTYFVRFWLEFEYESVYYTMASRGHFDEAEWEHLTNTGENDGEVNLTYLSELGLDGIIPDSGLALKKPIPIWPFLILVAITVLTGLVAMGSYVLDNPGKYPRLEGPVLRMNGKINQTKRRFFKRK